jgi:capsular exopolysaccharide synthesis family protein
VAIQSNGNNLALVESPTAHLPARHEGPGDSILEAVWRQRTVVGIMIAGFGLLALLYLLVATRYYSGTARLYVQQVSPRVLNEEQARPVQDVENFLATQREIVSSTPVLAMTLGTPGIRDLKTFQGEDNLFAFLKGNLSVDIGKKDELLSIQFDTPHKDEAQKIVAALVDAYTNFQSKQRHSSASERIALLQQEKEKRHAELQKKAEELHAFRATNGMVGGMDDRANVTRSKLEKLTTELTLANSETISAQIAWDDVSRSILTDPARKAAMENLLRTYAQGMAPSALDDAQLRTDMLRWQAALQDMSGKYLSGHPAVKTVQQNIDQLNVLYAAAVNRRLQNAKARETELQASFDRQRDLALEQNARTVKDLQLDADVKRLTALADEIDTRMRTIALTQDSASAPNITVLEPPSVSRKPTRPYIWQTLALALLAGAVVGCGAACVRDWYDYRLRSADEVKATLGVTVLGLVPHVADENSPIARGQKIHIDPQSDAAEAYRSLRTAIYFGSKDDRTRTICVTSPERGDGKTTLASNLAISMAQAGRRVLLVDADLRAPMQDLIFGINGRVGLASVLQNKETLAKAIRHTGIEFLDLLPAGVAARNPSELLNSQRFIDLLEELGDKYDHVVIDTTPLLAVTDARIVAASSDATLLVVRAGKSNRKLSELSVDGLISVGAKLLGAVVNDIRRGGYRSYDRYGSYGYGSNGRSDRGALAASSDGTNGRHEEFPSDEGASALSARGRLTG